MSDKLPVPCEHCQATGLLKAVSVGSARTRADIHDGQALKGSINRPDTEAQDQLLQTAISKWTARS